MLSNIKLPNESETNRCVKLFLLQADFLFIAAMLYLHIKKVN